MGEQGICSTILMIIEIWKEEWHTEWSWKGHKDISCIEIPNNVTWHNEAFLGNHLCLNEADSCFKNRHRLRHQPLLMT
jgi:hypothetical protein